MNELNDNEDIKSDNKNNNNNNNNNNKEQNNEIIEHSLTQINLDNFELKLTNTQDFKLQYKEINIDILCDIMIDTFNQLEFKHEKIILLCK